MISYNKQNLQNFRLLSDVKNWHNNGIISTNQYEQVQKAYPNNLYHPSIWLRGILFIATIIGVISGLGFIGITILGDVFDSEYSIRTVGVILGLGSLAFLEFVLITNKHHYKSGVSEAFLFLGLGFTIGSALGESHEMVYAIVLLLIGVFIVLRYLNLVGVLMAIGSLAFMLFYIISNIGGVLEQLLPFISLTFFIGLYLASQKIQKAKSLSLFEDAFTLTDSLLLLLAYLSVNYFVVREMSQELMGLYLEPGEDIPLAWIFYILTFLVPLIYILFGLKHRSKTLLRVGVLAIFMGVIAIKYYYSSGHPEITLTLAGTLLTGIAILLLNYLKIMRNGFTRERLLTTKWDSINAEALVISSTMGGNAQQLENNPEMGSGEFGGGGAGSSF